MKLRFVMSVTLAGAVLAAGCTGITTPTEPTDVLPGLLIWDAEHGDEGSHFYFLPPMVPNPGATGIFDTTQPVAVQICEWTDSVCADTISEFSVQAGTITVSVEDEHYLALWHAGDFALDTTKVYRIRVLVGQQELGYADVQPVGNASALKNLETGEVIGLVDDRTLPIKLRIEEGALGITIDGTALTVDRFAVGGIGLFLTTTPHVLDLAPGPYTVNDLSGGIHAFEVTATGDISYATEKEPYFDGAGTSQLTLVGYDVTIDATALTPPNFFIGGIGGFPSATVATLTFLPGVKNVQDGSGEKHFFEVTEAGTVGYEAAKEPFFDGSGTAQLTLVGYSVIIDATALTGSFSIGGTGSFSTTVTHTITTVPGNKSFSSTDVSFVYEVRADGLLDYEASLDVILSGRNTTTLTVQPGEGP